MIGLETAAEVVASFKHSFGYYPKGYGEGVGATGQGGGKRLGGIREPSGGRMVWGNGGITMLRYRLALAAAGILLLTAPSAWAFSQQSSGSGDNGNSSFTDPDEQITNSFGLRSNEQPIQLGVQQKGTFDPIWWEQSLHGYGPYYQTPPRGK